MSPQEELEEKLADEEVIIEEIRKIVLEHIPPAEKTWTGQKRKFDCQGYTVSIDPYVIKIVKDNKDHFEFELRIFINDAADVVMWQTWPGTSAWRVPLSDPDCFEKVRNNLQEMIPAIKSGEGERNGNEGTGRDGSGGRPA